MAKENTMDNGDMPKSIQDGVETARLPPAP